MKKSTYLVLPIAAFALAATSASAFNPDLLAEAGLSEDQIAAFEEARELRKHGDRDGARDVLAEAGIDLDTLDEMRAVLHHEHDMRQENREAIHDVIEADDYDTFKELVGEDGPLAEAVDSEADFDLLREAHELREAGDHEGAKAILDELGLKPGNGHGKRGSHRGQYWGKHQY